MASHAPRFNLVTTDFRPPADSSEEDEASSVSSFEEIAHEPEVDPEPQPGPEPNPEVPLDG